MNIEEYLKNLSADSNNILEQSLAHRDKFGNAHHLSSCIYEFSLQIKDPQESELVMIVSSQLESATFNAGTGLYRQAFASLRLALEMGLAAIYFSAHKLHLYEWKDGLTDIKWSTLIDEDNGVLSQRFCKAFFKDSQIDSPKYLNKAKKTYRSLSEFVHGNSETWNGTGIELLFNAERLDLYFENYRAVVDTLLFAFTCRYAKSLSASSLESVQFLHEEMQHIAYIREYLGGPKE